jgi:BON domain
VTFRSRYWLAAALGACMVHSQGAFAATPAAEPPHLDLHDGPNLSAVPSSNQRIADAIADHLHQSAQLHGYSVDVDVQNGVARITGTVADQTQREEVLRIAHGVPGVERVLDRLTTPSGVAAARADEALPPLPGAPTLEPTPIRRNDGPAVETLPGAPQAEPVPLFQGPAPSPYDLNPPKMPPYAWPTYAPYNNYSRVATPLAYPYDAFPFIGPCYPFPKVPLGWRSVKLEWDDGYWWFSKTATKYNWWHLRYW